MPLLFPCRMLRREGVLSRSPPENAASPILKGGFAESFFMGGYAENAVLYMKLFSSILYKLKSVCYSNTD